MPDYGVKTRSISVRDDLITWLLVDLCPGTARRLLGEDAAVPLQTPDLLPPPDRKGREEEDGGKRREKEG